MREKVRDNDRLQHILDAINALEQGAKRYTVQQASEDCIIDSPLKSGFGSFMPL